MGLASDRAGNVYLAVTADRVVKKVSPAGNVSVVAKSPVPWSPTGVLPASNGDLWILEDAGPFKARVRRVRPDGSSTSF